jgi:O-antigen ligase
MRTGLSLEKITAWGGYLLLVLLPLQTRYILVSSANPFAMISVYGFDILLVLVGLLWLWHWYRSNTPVNWTAVSIGLALLAVAGCSAFFAEDRTLALYYWLHLAAGLWLLAIVATTKLNHTTLLSILTLSGCIQVLAGTIQFITQHVVANKWLGMSSQFPELSGTSVVITATGRWLRAYALLPHPNLTGGLIVLALVSAALLSKKYWAIAIAGGVLSFGLLLTFSRGALVAWCVSLVIMVVGKQVRASFVLATLAVLIVTIAVYWPLVSTRTTQTGITQTYTEQLSLSERRDQLQQFTELMKTRWPFGVGIGQYTITANNTNALDYAQPIHNVALMILVEMGVLGALLWLALLVQAIWKWQYQIIRHPAAYLLAACLALSVFDHYLWTLPTGLFLMMVMIGWLHLPVPQHQPKMTKTSSHYK